MQRRNTFAIAATITVIAASAALALGANLGMFGLTRESGPGNFQLVDHTPGVTPATAPPAVTPTTVGGAVTPGAVPPTSGTLGTTSPATGPAASLPTGGAPAGGSIAPTPSTTRPSDDTRHLPGQDD